MILKAKGKLSGLDFTFSFNTEVNEGMFRSHTNDPKIRRTLCIVVSSTFNFKQIRYIINNYSLPPQSHDLTGSSDALLWMKM